MTADEMLRRATECCLLAQSSQHLESRLTFLEMAQTWQRLARQRDLLDEVIGTPGATKTDATLPNHGNVPAMKHPT